MTSDLLTVRELATYLSTRIPGYSVTTARETQATLIRIYRQAADGRLPRPIRFGKRGGSMRWRRADINRWLVGRAIEDFRRASDALIELVTTAA